jgi:hypothetical protein
VRDGRVEREREERNGVGAVGVDGYFGDYDAQG